MKTPHSPILALVSTMLVATPVLAETHDECIKGLAPVYAANSQASARYSQSAAAYIRMLQIRTAQGVRGEFSTQEREAFEQQLADAKQANRASDAVRAAEARCDVIRTQERQARMPKSEPLKPGQCSFTEHLWGNKKDGQCK